MASIRVSPAVERLISDALKKLPVSQTKEQFIEDAVSRYVDELRRMKYRIKRLHCLPPLM